MTRFGSLSASGPAAPARSDSFERGGRLPRPISVALVNDYEVIVRGLHAMLEPFADRLRVVEHEIGGTPDTRVDIALFDTFAGRRDALDRAKAMVDEHRVRHVVVYTWDASSAFLEIAGQIGVSGVVLKSATGKELADMLECIADGERVGLEHVTKHARAAESEELSQREREVLALLAMGRSNHEIAHELFLSVDTVKTYLRRLFRKLDVSNRTQAALRAWEFEVAPPLRRVGAGGGD